MLLAHIGQSRGALVEVTLGAVRENLAVRGSFTSFRMTRERGQEQGQEQQEQVQG